MRFPVAMLFAALAVAACGGQTQQGSDLNSGATSSGSGSTTPPGTSGGGGTPTTGGSQPGGTSTGGTPTDGGSTPTPPDPTLARTTYVAPATVDTRTVASSNGGGAPNVSAYAYSVFPAVDGWSPIQTVPYPIIDLAVANQISSGTFTDTAGVSRVGYKFTIAPGDSPDWGGAPRVEFDSATGAVQNAPGGMPSPNGWADGVITSGMEMWFSWSMYLDASFALNQKWSTLFQLHPGNTNYDPNSSKNAWPNQRWPALMADAGVLSFGLGPDAASAGQVWSAKLADYRGKWTDLAFHAKFSTGSDGLMELYVNGEKVGSVTGPNLVYATLGGTPPWYYLKQGYYRDASVSTTDSVYQTPILVTVNGN